MIPLSLLERLADGAGVSRQPIARALNRRLLRSWMLRWCTRLATLDRRAFEATVLRTPLDSHAPFLDGDISSASTLAEDLLLAAAIAELSEQQRVLLCMLKQGAAYREIAAALGMSDECALRALAALLCELARKTSSIPAAEAAKRR